MTSPGTSLATFELLEKKKNSSTLKNEQFNWTRSLYALIHALVCASDAARDLNFKCSSDTPLDLHVVL